VLFRARHTRMRRVEFPVGRLVSSARNAVI
jgi:hypothetical protein